MRLFLPLLASALLVGCAPKAEEPAAATDAPPATAQGSGVAPMTSGAAGGMTPVTGAESVGGAGMGGLGTAAKDQARRTAAAPGGIPQMGEPIDGE